MVVLHPDCSSFSLSESSGANRRCWSLLFLTKHSVIMFRREDWIMHPPCHVLETSSGFISHFNLSLTFFIRKNPSARAMILEAKSACSNAFRIRLVFLVIEKLGPSRLSEASFRKIGRASCRARV